MLPHNTQIVHQLLPMLNLGINNELFPSSTTTTTILHDAYPPCHHCYPCFTTTTITITNGCHSHLLPMPTITTASMTSTTSQQNEKGGGICRCHITKSDMASKQWTTLMLFILYYWWWVPPPSSHPILLMVTTQQMTCHHCAHKWQTSSHEQPTHTNKPHHLQSTTCSSMSYTLILPVQIQTS